MAVTGPPGNPVVLERRLIVTCDDSVRGSKQPYHAAERMDIAAAEAWIRACRDRSTHLATVATRDLIGDLSEVGYRVAAAGILFASGRTLPELPMILRSHALLHTAEGEFYREALLSASDRCSLPVRRIKERDAWDLVEPNLEKRIGELGKAVGPPWRQDEKLACLAACIALEGVRTGALR